jgi:hypothetical protein
MKNNILSAMVVFFAVVACLLIIDDIAYNKEDSSMDYSKEKQKESKPEFATADLETDY